MAELNVDQGDIICRSRRLNRIIFCSLSLCLGMAFGSIVVVDDAQAQAYIIQPVVVKFAARGRPNPWYLWDNIQSPGCENPDGVGLDGQPCKKWYESYDGATICRQAVGDGTPPPPQGEPDWCKYGWPTISNSSFYVGNKLTATGNAPVCYYYQTITSPNASCWDPSRDPGTNGISIPPRLNDTT